MSDSLDELKMICGDRLKENEPLARYTTFKIGGPADYFFDARSKEEFTRVVCFARKAKIPLCILGGGTNILIGDRGIRGLVVKNSTQAIIIRGVKGSMAKRVVFVESDSGVPMNKLVRFTIEEGLAGLEMQLGLPGTVGGAVYMNSKWTKPEGYVGDPVYQATIVTAAGEVMDVPREYFKFAYDYSTIQKTRDVVISVTFSLNTDTKERLWQLANDSISYRRETQPQGVFSAGCTFKNITKAQALAHATPNLTTSAGFLIDHAGLKGEKAGDAQISPVHANFMINQKAAKAKDVVELIERAKAAVKEQFGVELEEEIERIGEF